MSGITDNIIQKIIHKDEKSLLIFYRTYHTVLIHFFYRKTGKRDVAEELTQDTFLDFIESVRDFRGESSVKTFLFTIARNKAVDYIKKKRLKQILFSAISPYVVESLMSVVMNDELERKELSQKIEQVISRLPNDYQLVLRLKYMDGRKVQEIAITLALSFKATESLLFRARKAFIQLFDQT